MSDCLARQDRLDRPLGHHLAAVLAGRRPEVDDVVGAADQRAVVLDHQHRVAARREVAQQAEQALAVLRVQADRRLVEHVEGAGEAGAQGGGEVDALRLAAREGARLAVEGQVVEPHPVEHLDALRQLVEQVRRPPRAGAGVQRRPRSQARSCSTLSAVRSGRVRPSRWTASASGCRRVPPQSGQGL